MTWKKLNRSLHIYLLFTSTVIDIDKKYEYFFSRGTETFATRKHYSDN